MPPRPPPREGDHGEHGGHDPGEGAQRGGRQELEGRDRHVLVGEEPDEGRVARVIVHHDVPEKARVPRGGERVPAGADHRHEDDAERRKPGRDGTEAAGQRGRARHGEERADESDRILRERGQPQRHAAGERPPAPRLAPADEEAGEAPLYRGEEQRLRPHVAREGGEQRA
jgi:hypothetical protein